ncbi:MAG: serine/threonine-protein kinase [Pseudomonadota bacterium]
MTNIDPRIVDNIFSGALELTGAERTRYVENQCNDNDALKARVLTLLGAADREENQLDSQLVGIRERVLKDVLASDDSFDAEDLAGHRFDAWRLEERLARGGLATVYLAQRDDGQYDQRAAFKVLRRGLDTDDLVARFKAERQILSALEHPGIASILDGGALPDGRPYLVLEYVDGQPITVHADEHGLAVHERIGLVQQMLRALQHAHQHLIVHRDIKPSNILVSAGGHVALLDFGIAKLLDPEALPGASTMTRTGISMLTPGYSSPEQQVGAPVTTASDIYQAGAVLYELITGSRPRVLTSNDDASIVPSPSTLLRGRPDYQAVRGDLDAIVNKAMHVDPVQRYSSAEAMTADLQRCLEGQPVLAQPDSLPYRLDKLHRRKPWLIPSAAVAFLVTVGFLVTLISYNAELRLEQESALQAQNFLIEVLSSADPFRPADPDLGRDITLSRALDLGLERLYDDLLLDPELRASVLASMAAVYASLDQHEQATALQEEALAVQRDLHGAESEPVFAGLKLLAESHHVLGNHEQAATYSDELLHTAETMFGRGHPAWGEAKTIDAQLAVARGDLGEAEAKFQQAVAVLRHAPGEHTQPLISALLDLASIHMYEENGKAVRYVGEAEQIARTAYGLNSLPMALALSRRATTHSAVRRYEEAEVDFKSSIRIYEDRIGREHGTTLATINDLGILYNRMGKHAEAGELYAEVLERYQAKFGELHRTVADSYQNLATAWTRAGRYTESIPMHRRAYEIYLQVLPKEQEVLAYPLLSKAYAELNTAQFQAAEATATTALDIAERTEAAAYIVGVARCLISRSLEGQDDPDAAAMMLIAHDLLVDSIVSDTYRSFCRVP